MAPSSSPAANSRAISASPATAASATVLLDGDKEGDGKAYFRLAGIDHSTDHSRGLWGYDDKGSEYYTLRVRDLATGEDLADVIENTGGGGAWAPDGKSFFYTVLDDNHRPSKIFHHIVGTPQSDDRLVYEEEDPGFFMGVGGSMLDDFIYIDIHDHETSEYWLMPTSDLDGQAATGLGARNRARIFADRGRRRLLHPDQCRRRQGFQDHADAG